MNGRFVWLIGAAAAIGVMAGAQTTERRAAFTGGGNPGEGKCTIEVVVDASAEVEIRGDRGILRTLGGRPAEWRRFQCTSPMPPNPSDFRFDGVDGRGSQQLQRDPRRGGVAVVRIDDSAGGSEGYTFDLVWRMGGNFGPPPGPPPGPGPGFERGGDRRFDGDRRDRDRRRFAVEDAIRVCQDAVRGRASDRMRGARIEFRRTAIDDNPGRSDWVIGTFDAIRDNGRFQSYRFSCSVDFDNGRVRSADFDRADRR
jgi:hypothetical protein